jgi:predicted amidophosphoribosyltransferase
MRRLHSNRIFCTLGWSCKDYRSKSKLYIGNALLCGGENIQDWNHFDVPQKQTLHSALDFLKGRDSSSETETLDFLANVIGNSVENTPEGKCTIFQRQYDVICPIPSSKGPVSIPNLKTAQMLSKSLLAQPQIELLVNRHRPMKLKSEMTDKSVRMEIDAPRKLHYSSMSIESSLLNSIRGKKILLYDDIIAWGNVTEAARNLLLILGAAEVDVFCVFWIRITSQSYNIYV